MFFKPCLFALAVVLLAACGSQPIATPTASAPIATVTAQSQVDLPGRLLFAAHGDVWMWQGANGAQITNQGDLYQPSWSPNGLQIVCIQRGPSYSEVALLPATGGAPQTITAGDSAAPINSFERARSTLWSFYPHFSGDSTSVVYVSQAAPAEGEPAADYPLALYETVAAVGGQREALYTPEAGQVGQLSVASDGSTALALSPTTGEEPQILIYQDGDLSAIDGLPGQSYDPAFSADAQWLLFTHRSAEGSDVYAIASTGGTPIKLTSSGQARAAAMSPDGAWLAFLAVTPGTSSFDLWVAPLTSNGGTLSAGEPKQLSKGLQIDADSGLSWGL